MNNERYCETISSRLAQLVSEVRQSSASNLHSINIHAESFFREFLNVLYGWKLSNANAVQPNATGIDLLYPGENVVVQVSSTTTHEKVQSSLEKSARFPGAHFFFVAIADELPNYKKAFDKHGLIFDPDADILDTTKLCDLTVKHEGYGSKKAIDVQKELFDLVEKYFSRQERRKELHLHPLGQSKAKSLFEYHAEAVPLLGRDAELAELKRFVTRDPGISFSWWAITGPGAAGKTRLAYELQKQLLREGEWDVAVISPAVLDRYVREEPDLSDACPGRTLFIVDYVQKHTEALALLVKRLSDPDLDRTAPLRLLLLERDIRDEDGRISWLEQIWGTNHHVHDSFFGRTPLPLSLSPLRAAGGDEPDPLEVLIRAFADRLCEGEDPETVALHPLPAGKEAYLRSRLEEIDPGLLRPLFAMILADAYVRDPETERWSRKELLAHIVDREWDILDRRIAPFHHPSNRLLPDSFRILWMSATVLGAGDSPLPLERIKDLLPQAWETLSRAAAKHEEELESWTAGPEEELLQRAGLLSEGWVQPLRPDLLGEYMVLEALDRSSTAERNAFLSAVLSAPAATLIFFGRVLDDYGTLLLQEERLWSAAFPSNPQTELEKLALYAELLRRLFEQPRKNAVRGKLSQSLTALAARQQGEEKEIAYIFSETATVLHAMGDYTNALEYCEKALEIQKIVLGLNHPDTATTYNNLAVIYQTTRDYQKALEYYEKSRKIVETILGPEHPNTATTYNNLAYVYQDLGDYQKALELNDKARMIRETVLGLEHPDTAMTYNNIAHAYQAMGDHTNALEYYEKSRKVFETVLGPEHPDTAMTYNNMALVYQAMGDHTNALEYYERARKVAETVLGPEHPNTATTYNNLAQVYEAMGDHPKALEYSEKARKVAETVLGPEHPDMTAIYNNLSSAYQAMNDYQKALEYLDKVRKIRETVLGLEHQDTATTYFNLAVLYYKAHRLEEALRYSNQALAIFKRILGPDHHNTRTVVAFNEYLRSASSLNKIDRDNMWSILSGLQ